MRNPPVRLIQTITRVIALQRGDLTWIWLDVLTLENIRPGPNLGGGNGSAAGGGSGQSGIAVKTAPPQVHFTAIAEPERYARKRKRVAIRHRSGFAVVAVIEIVSPHNKASRRALQTFVDQASELHEAGIHLLVIDLFPPGSRDPQGIHAALWSEVAEDNFQLPGGLGCGAAPLARRA